MAGQGLFFRLSNVVSNCRFLLNNRVVPINQVSGLKQKAVDKLKELKVPEKPKRPLSPYFKFIQEHRSTIMKKHPDWKVTEVSKQCSIDWKHLDPATKERYDSEFKSQLEVYAKQCAEYSKRLTKEQKEALQEYRKEVQDAKARRRRRKKMREYDKPKRPIGAYMLYVMEQAKTRDKSYMKLLTELKGAWAQLPDTEKQWYLDEANRAKKEYEERLKAWEKKMIEEGNTDIVRHSTLAKKPRARSE